MGNRLIHFLAIIAATFVGLTMPASTQSTRKFVRIEDGALNKVNSEMRDRLVERLELYVGSLRYSDLGSIYDLMPDACRHGLAKDEWLKQVRHESPGRIQQFVIEEVSAEDYTAPENLYGERWIARGCGTYQVAGESISYKKSVRTLLLGGEWYVCGSGIAVEGTDNQYIRCPDPASNN